MFENLNEQEAREKVLDFVSDYCKKYHVTPEYEEGQRIPYAARIYDNEEMINLVDSALEFWLTSGKYSELFEKKFSEFLNIKYSVLVNSGSSANLLAFMCLTSPLLHDKQIKKGDEIITIAAGFPTTVAPIIQYGAIPVFVDVTIPQYNIDVTLLEEAYSKRTKAVMIAHTMGNPFDIKHVKEFCEKYNLWLIEDNCDSLGSQYCLNSKWSYTGTFGDVSTSSFYPPHHMTMGEGGAVYTNNPLLYKIIKSLRDWGRDCECPSGVDNLCGHRFDRKYGELPLGYDHKYVYSHFGYNLKATDMQAAIGVAQLNKLHKFIGRRRDNFDTLKKGLSSVQDRMILPEACPDSLPSWFGFLLTCNEESDRNKIVANLEVKGIQTRMLFAGNITKHPCFNMLKQNEEYRIVGELDNTDKIMRNSLWIGVYPGMTENMLNYIMNAITEYCGNN